MRLSAVQFSRLFSHDAVSAERCPFCLNVCRKRTIRWLIFQTNYGTQSSPLLPFGCLAYGSLFVALSCSCLTVPLTHVLVSAAQGQDRERHGALGLYAHRWPAQTRSARFFRDLCVCVCVLWLRRFFFVSCDGLVRQLCAYFAFASCPVCALSHHHLCGCADSCLFRQAEDSRPHHSPSKCPILT